MNITKIRINMLKNNGKIGNRLIKKLLRMINVLIRMIHLNNQYILQYSKKIQFSNNSKIFKRAM